jgi:septal ring factor EnvC (AmiA/AmiB activator)
MEKKILPYLVVFSALSVSLSAAFYSVTGLGKMFSGASMQVMIMMGSLEIAKLVLASLLYQYWGRLNKALKFYYFVALFVLMMITSAGIYGYLSSAYSETSNKVENIDKQVKVLDVKREMFQTQLNDARSEKERITSNITELTKAVSNNFVQSKDKSGNIITTSSSANRKVYEEQLKSSQKRRDDILLTETALNDSITKIDLKKLDLETNTDLAGEVGPLKYIAKLTGSSMDQVINWFIIALMLVFDPLAVSLVVGANVIFGDKNKEKEKLEKVKLIDSKIQNFEEREKEFNQLEQEFQSKLRKIEESESKSLERISDRLKEAGEREKEINDLDEQIRIKAEEINLNFQTKERGFESYVDSEKLELEGKRLELEDLQRDLQQKTENYRELILKEEEEYKSKLEEQRNKIEHDSQDLKRDRKDFNNFKKKLLEDREDLDSLSGKLESREEELNERENELERVKEELVNLDQEIKNWEGLSSIKLRRIRRPPSAI